MTMDGTAIQLARKGKTIIFTDLKSTGYASMNLNEICEKVEKCKWVLTEKSWKIEGLLKASATCMKMDATAIQLARKGQTIIFTDEQ